MRAWLTPVLGVVSDAWAIGFGIFSLAFNAFLTFSIWKLTAGQKKTEGLEDLLRKRTEDLIETRFRELSHEVRGSVSSFMLTLEEMKQRMREAEQGFDALGDADHGNEIKHLQRLEQIKDYIRDNTASKADVRDHERSVQQKFDSISEVLAKLRTDVALIGQRVGERI